MSTKIALGFRLATSCMDEALRIARAFQPRAEQLAQVQMDRFLANARTQDLPRDADPQRLEAGTGACSTTVRSPCKAGPWI